MLQKKQEGSRMLAAECGEPEGRRESPRDMGGAKEPLGLGITLAAEWRLRLSPGLKTS